MSAPAKKQGNHLSKLFMFDYKDGTVGYIVLSHIVRLEYTKGIATFYLTTDAMFQFAMDSTEFNKILDALEQ